MDGNTLILKAAAEDEAGTMLFSCDTMRLSLLDDGKLCFEPESDGSEEETSGVSGAGRDTSSCTGLFPFPSYRTENL